MSPAETTSTALYYPAAIWTDGDWLKTALLFFDKIALLRRDANHEKDTVLDAELIDLLESNGFLHITEPATEIDDTSAARLRTALRDDAVWNALDAVGGERHFYYGARVFSTLNGPEPSLEMMELRNVLMERINSGTFVAQSVGGHAYPTYRVEGQAPDVPIHIRLWAPLMSTLPQYLRGGPLGAGGAIVPLANHDSGGIALLRMLGLPGMPSAGTVEVVEPLPVSPDISDLPWSEALALREEVAEECASLIAGLRQAIVTPNSGSREALDEAADSLRRRIAGLAGRRAVFQLGAVGSAWSAKLEGEHKLKELAALLRGPNPDNSLAWTVVFRRGASIAAREH